MDTMRLEIKVKASRTGNPITSKQGTGNPITSKQEQRENVTDNDKR